MNKAEPTATQGRRTFTQETHRDGVGSVQDMERSFLVRKRLLKAFLEEATPGIHRVGEDRLWACECRIGWSFQVEGAASTNCGGDFGRGETIVGIEVATPVIYLSIYSFPYPPTYPLITQPVHRWVIYVPIYHSFIHPVSYPSVTLQHASTHQHSHLWP